MIAFFHGCMDSVAGWKRPLHMQFAVLFIADPWPSKKSYLWKRTGSRPPMPFLASSYALGDGLTAVFRKGLFALVFLLAIKGLPTFFRSAWIAREASVSRQNFSC
ncbi:hypothetical protein [Rhizobium mongolense]|uniref:Uncharacterized protein n=2 Tax=Rhizobium mongolense TaxID=57676 RepID=A0ABR6IR12_9HYPH|nr:hypothetical protein [Rhizobium mongolense]MBB4230230.1 hypothetical protein [Rhizobium mongolense]